MSRLKQVAFMAALMSAVTDNQESQPEPKAEQSFYKRKISRNDPCPCNSGKKYKRCCIGGAP